MVQLLNVLLVVVLLLRLRLLRVDLDMLLAKHYSLIVLQLVVPIKHILTLLPLAFQQQLTTMFRLLVLEQHKMFIAELHQFLELNRLVLSKPTLILESM